MHFGTVVLPPSHVVAVGVAQQAGYLSEDAVANTRDEQSDKVDALHGSNSFERQSQQVVHPSLVSAVAQAGTSGPVRRGAPCPIRAELGDDHDVDHLFAQALQAPYTGSNA